MAGYKRRRPRGRGLNHFPPPAPKTNLASNGDHMGSVSADSIDPHSIGDPITDGLVDQPQQERGEELNFAVEMEMLGS